MCPSASAPVPVRARAPKRCSTLGSSAHKQATTRSQQASRQSTNPLPAPPATAATAVARAVAGGALPPACGVLLLPPREGAALRPAVAPLALSSALPPLRARCALPLARGVGLRLPRYGVVPPRPPSCAARPLPLVRAPPR